MFDITLNLQLTTFLSYSNIFVITRINYNNKDDDDDDGDDDDDTNTASRYIIST